MHRAIPLRTLAGSVLALVIAAILWGSQPAAPGQAATPQPAATVQPVATPQPAATVQPATTPQPVATPGTVYRGSMSDGGTVTVTINTQGTGVAVLFDYGGAIPDGCAGGVSATATLSATGGSFSLTTSTPLQPHLAFDGFWDLFSREVVVGSLAADPVPGSSCPVHRLTWLASNGSIALTSQKPLGNTTFAGPIYDALSGAPAGHAEVTTNAAATGVTFRLAYAIGSCQSTVFSTAPSTLHDGGWFAESDPTSGGTSAVGVVGPDAFAGAFSFPAGSTCPAAVGVYLARLASATATATATPTGTANPTFASTTGRITAGSIPTNGGFGLFVFGGGSLAQLVDASGCPGGAVAFWASNGSGDFDAYISGTRVSAVNAAWNARFTSGIPAGTPLIGRCL